MPLVVMKLPRYVKLYSSLPTVLKMHKTIWSALLFSDPLTGSEHPVARLYAKYKRLAAEF